MYIRDSVVKVEMSGLLKCQDLELQNNRLLVARAGLPHDVRKNNRKWDIVNNINLITAQKMELKRLG